MNLPQETEDRLLRTIEAVNAIFEETRENYWAIHFCEIM